MTDSPQKASGRLVLAPELPLHAALVGAFDGILAYALAMVRAVEVEPVQAVHRYRKSLRRARALLRLVRPGLNAEDYDWMVSALRDLMRPTSGLRDVDVLVQTCAETELGEPASAVMSTVQGLLEVEKRTLVAEAKAATVLREGARKLPDVSAGLAAALTPTISHRGVADGFDKTWRRARKTGRRARRDLADEAIHRWRTRVKEVRYQLELLAEPEGGPVRDLERAYGRLAKRLGTVTDLIALRRYAQAHRYALPEGAADIADRALEDSIRRRFSRVAGETHDVRCRIEALAVDERDPDES